MLFSLFLIIDIQDLMIKFYVLIKISRHLGILLNSKTH